MAEPSQQPRLDMYAQDLLRQSYQAMPISQDVLSQYGQGMAQQVQQPAIDSYAPQQAPMPQQQFVQQAPQQMLRPSDKRIAYNKLIEDRFNEIVNYAGGMERAIKANALQVFQQKAIKDIQNIYGEAPAIEQPMSEKERVELEQAKLQERKARFDLQQAQKQAENPEKKPSEVMSKVMTKASDYLVTIDPMLGQLEQALVQLESPDTDINSKLSNARTLGKLINSLQVGSPDAVGADEAKMLMSELNEKVFNPSGIFTSEQVFGTNLPQFVNKMKSLRDRVSGEYNKNLERLAKFDPLVSTYYQPREITSPAGQQAGQPKVRTWVPGKGFQD